ncbi:MAG: NAD(P)-dependent oxidoreductase [Chloroflexota bacterium]
MTKLNLLILDDNEGELAAAPAVEKLRELANVTIMNRPITAEDYDDLAKYHTFFALRERTKIDADFLDQFPNLELILQSGGHAYHLDRAAASERGIAVALGRGAKQPMIIMPQLTWGLILALNRQLLPIHRQMEKGEWPDVIGSSLHGKTLGILGYGRHGKPVAEVGRIFGMKIATWDRGGDYSNDEEDVTRLPLDELFASADVITVQLKLSDESRGLITRELLEKMKPTAYFVNTSRGAIVDEAALADVLAAGKIAGAGLDVFAHEPLAADSPLRSLPNVILTPHIGWKVNTTLHEWMGMAADQLEAWLNGALDPKIVMNPEAMEVDRIRHGKIKAN